MVTIKKAAELTGVTVKAIRHYESCGLIHSPERQENGYRMYSEDDICRLQKIRHYKDLKFSLHDIALLLDASPEYIQQAIIRQQAEVDRCLEEYKRAQMLLQAAIFGNSMAYHQNNSECIPAIVAIDLQNDILEGGALPCKRIHNILPTLKKLFVKARNMGIPIIYVCDRHFTDDPELLLWNDHMMAGSYGIGIIDEVAPEKGDYIVYKNRFNGFVNTNLESTLKKLNVNTLVIVGWRSHVCVAQTAVEAFYRGYRVAIAEDGVDSTTEIEHEQGMQLMAINYNFDFYPCETILENLVEK